MALTTSTYCPIYNIWLITLILSFMSLLDLLPSIHLLPRFIGGKTIPSKAWRVSKLPKSNTAFRKNMFGLFGRRPASDRSWLDSRRHFPPFS
ncbi:hypothetical protein B9Z19DRAFT_1094312 [Tuber borchii]|uniref:Uncharacterized protein n=1 Tax=Tuber borchii TaxID=42251 RepID=A0A2T6ZEJ0_TUBBO|nr:hypothetical protein B9Z19DRAFT_1094312 [Tuber borchii]